MERDPPAAPGPAGCAPSGLFSARLWGQAFSPDRPHPGRRLHLPGWSLWNVADPARPRLLRSLGRLNAPLPVGQPGPGAVSAVTQGDLVFSRGAADAGQRVPGSGQVTVWDVARPARATRIATLAGPGDYFAALAFSPAGTCWPA